ncbi:hypothetical protein M9Y10_028979 [Tritrichomonas musculus]|uniref:CS domain-containing protein n=1 Tax=Tritrichomonas musculus TaxID=1915356 RepID=A0ABR2KKS5_9EUKA
MNSSLKKTADDAIILNMNKKNYHVAIVLLEQLQHEHMKLSKENQVRLCECLIHVDRLLDALVYIRKFTEQGNSLSTLRFLRGVAYFKSNEFFNAKEIFDQYPEWSRWSDKCQLMIDISKDKRSPIFIGESPRSLIDPKNPIKPEVIQDAKHLFFQFPIKGVLPSNVEVTVLPYSLDVVIKFGKDEYKRSFELFEAIIPKSLVKNVTFQLVEIKVEKVQSAIWQIIERTPEDIINETDITLEKVVDALNSLPNYTDQEASELFEKSQTLVMGDPRKTSTKK